MRLRRGARAAWATCSGGLSMSAASPRVSLFPRFLLQCASEPGLAGALSDAMSGALFSPFRALGYITDSVPFAVQRRGAATFLTVSVGKAWQVRPPCTHLWVVGMHALPCPASWASLDPARSPSRSQIYNTDKLRLALVGPQVCVRRAAAAAATAAAVQRAAAAATAAAVRQPSPSSRVCSSFLASNHLPSAAQARHHRACLQRGPHLYRHPRRRHSRAPPRARERRLRRGRPRGRGPAAAGAGGQVSRLLPVAAVLLMAASQACT